jgi:hypothetical protein
MWQRITGGTSDPEMGVRFPLGPLNQIQIKVWRCAIKRSLMDAHANSGLLGQYL